MTDISFYHLTTSPLERALPRLLEKILGSHQRAVIVCASQERLDFLNSALWTLGRTSFIPHGTVNEGFAEDQPIWLTLKDENPNGSTFLIQTDNVDSPSLSTFERCLDLFDGNDSDSLNLAREKWKKYKAAGHTLTYWKQSETGAWEKGG